VIAHLSGAGQGLWGFVAMPDAAPKPSRHPRLPLLPALLSEVAPVIAHGGINRGVIRALATGLPFSSDASLSFTGAIYRNEVSGDTCTLGFRGRSVTQQARRSFYSASPAFSAKALA
jgi:hypothetical protein